jgi:hypothetical protein
VSDERILCHAGGMQGRFIVRSGRKPGRVPARIGPSPDQGSCQSRQDGSR